MELVDVLQVLSARTLVEQRSVNLLVEGDSGDEESLYVPGTKRRRVVDVAGVDVQHSTASVPVLLVVSSEVFADDECFHHPWAGLEGAYEATRGELNFFLQ